MSRNGRVKLRLVSFRRRCLCWIGSVYDRYAFVGYEYAVIQGKMLEN